VTYFERLGDWAAKSDRYTVESTDNGIATFVTIRDEDGFSAPGYADGTGAAALDQAATSAAHLFKAIKRSGR
jgi:hypothetical protein